MHQLDRAVTLPPPFSDTPFSGYCRGGYCVKSVYGRAEDKRRSGVESCEGVGVELSLEDLCFDLQKV